jgi:group II intron reverse transcriptase/maturase
MSGPHKHESNEAPLRGGLTSRSAEDAVMALEQSGQPGTGKVQQQQWRKAQDQQQKTYAISRREVKAAWQRVRAKGGVGGVDGESINSFEESLNNNLYKLWNRMSSGSYHPKAVRRVEIPKGDGKMRPLGIPTISDRVAQEVVRARLEPVVEQFFHPNSYGYRRKKSAPQAVGSCRERCWQYDWVLDVDIQKFFDTINHELMMKAVKKHCTEKWMLLYIERWLKAPVKHANGEVEESQRGTPQGGVISPLLANLYLHYAFDTWLGREFPGVVFERYADDIVIHCKSEEQSVQIKQALTKRLEECELKLHPDKTKIVYCKDGSRKGMYPTKKFTFLGYTFQQRSAQNRMTGRIFSRFLPAVSVNKARTFRKELKEKRIFTFHQHSLKKLAEELNPRVRGWYNYFTHFYHSATHRMNDWLDASIVRWLRVKFRTTWREAYQLLRRLYKQNPKRFAHWSFRSPGRAV